MNAELKTRWQTAMDNLKGASNWRPRDVANFATMLWSMPRPVKRDAPPLHPAQVALAMFTRMQVSYQPTATAQPSLGSSEGDRQAAWHLAEPTVALFVDAPEHLSGVSLTLKSWADEAQRFGMPFYLHLAGSESRMPGSKVFPSVGNLKLSSYDGLDVPIPDAKAVLDFMRGHPFDVAHLSTPGPMGLLGMRIARDHGAPICGTYHTDFPRYVRELGGDAELEDFTWQFMVWFYGQMDVVAAPSQATKDDLVAHGLDPRRIHVVGRGVDTSVFHPDHRREELRRSWGAANRPVFLYVGRVSREKNLPLLAEAYRRFLAQGGDAVLAVVGDGPYRAEMESALAGTPAVFTGALFGDALSAAFASGDVFAFPSETDTFGRVLIEAQASGLPALVSDKGGPRDTVEPGKTGWIIPDVSAARFADAMRAALADPEHLAAMKAQARRHALRFSPEASFRAFWNLHRLALQQKEDTHAVH